ncbi:MAG TPA: DEAD/DEAH box helicase [Thermomicrobiales bacterium]|jgi:superfamily II DNA or RNA helicase
MPGRFGGRPGYWTRRTKPAEVAEADTETSAGHVEIADTSEIDDLFAALDFGDEEAEAPEPPIVSTVAAPSTSTPASVAHLLTAGVQAAYGLPRSPVFDLTPRPYQEEAIDAWAKHGGRGVIVLPTGAGKTVVALMAAARLGVRTLVVAPTIELLHQWRAALSERLGYPLDEVGIVGGGKRTVRDLTVITYDSAAMPHRRLDGFGLLIVDEVHHLPARAYRSIAGKVNAPFRLGLSATPERSDDGHEALDHLVGPIVYRKSAAELSRDQHIAAYTEKRLFVDLTADERFRYDQLMAEYKWYLATHRAYLGGRPETLFVELIRRSGQDPAARSALRAHHQARLIALNAEAKLAKVSELLAKHQADKVIVFSEYNSMVDILSERLLLPAITYRTPLPERRRVLDRFRSGDYAKLVTGRVLNEGVDVPDANVAIVVSGSSATREYIQRLGRVLRPKREKALLYELVTRKTTEGKSARKRRPTEAARRQGGEAART